MELEGISYAEITLGKAVRLNGHVIGLVLSGGSGAWHTPYSAKGYPLDPTPTIQLAAKALVEEWKRKI